MATRFPLQLNNIRFSVNPTNLTIAKGVNYGTLPTQGGVKYHIWYDTPEMLTISGVSAGKTAFAELLNLKRHFERTDKVSELFYKTSIYKGFITNLTVEHSTSHINEFVYTLQFQLLFGERFNIEDFSLTGQEAGIVSNTIHNLATFLNEPIRGFENTIERLVNRI